MQTTTKKIQLDDIAKELGLSKSTVSRAISGKGRISDSTRAKVAEYIKLHNYRPNVIAKSLAQSKTFNLGVLLPADKELSDIPFFQTCLMGVCEQAACLDYDVVVTTGTQGDISLLRRLIENNKVDGIIITRSVMNDPSVRYLEENGVPFVLIGSSQDDDVVQIDTDHVSACCELTSYLLSQYNSENVAFIAGNMGYIVNKNRCDGFKAAFAKRGVLPTESLIFTDAANKPLIEAACAEIIKRKPECIVCGDDYICSILMNVLNSKGITVPTEIKVASFYNSAFLRQSNPPVTAVDINVRELGAVAGRTLIEMISGATVPQRTLLSYELSIKKSTMK